MYKTVAEARHMVSEMVPGLQPIQGVEKVLCPPFTALLAVNALLEGTDIGIGAQNMYWESSGAFTGEISSLMIAELFQYGILGHSERRAYFGETDSAINKKVLTALSMGLKPIVCVGETLEENESGMTREVVSKQITSGLAGISLQVDESNTVDLIIAYEPVWAIGTGRAATSAGANRVIAEVIRPALETLFGERIAQIVRVLYGGSVKADNASEFFSQSDIDGALVGGASLKVSEFIQITQSAAG